MPEPSSSRDLSVWFWVVAAGMFCLNVLLGTATAPTAQAAAALGFLVGAVYIAAPLTGLFAAASGRWTAGKGWLWLILGALAHGGAVLASGFLPRHGLVPVLAVSLGQAGLLVWSCGLGILVSLLFREKNIILPVCLFLAGFDAFLIFNPYSFTGAMAASNSQVFQNVALTVPAPKVRPQPEAKPEERAPRIVPMAHIGPADLIFSTTFFAVLFRFKMKVKQTLRWLIPVLIAYLLAVFLSPDGMLPALVPIGLTILVVNRGEFSLTDEEKQGVWAVAVVAAGMAGYAVWARITYKPSRQRAAPPVSAPASSGARTASPPSSP